MPAPYVLTELQYYQSIVRTQTQHCLKQIPSIALPGDISIYKTVESVTQLYWSVRAFMSYDCWKRPKVVQNSNKRLTFYIFWKQQPKKSCNIWAYAKPQSAHASGLSKTKRHSNFGKCTTVIRGSYGVKQRIALDDPFLRSASWEVK